MDMAMRLGGRRTMVSIDRVLQACRTAGVEEIGLATRRPVGER
jgi:hypothetical protein